MVHGRSMVDGRKMVDVHGRSMVGRWSMCGGWSMVLGQGRWSMVGRWSMSMVGRWSMGTLPPALSNHLKCETPQATIDVKISSWAMAFGFLWKTSASRASSSILQQRNRTCNSSVIIESGLSHRFAISRGFLECLKRSGSVVREEVLSISLLSARRSRQK